MKGRGPTSGRQVVVKVVELLQNVDFTRNSGSTKPRNKPRIGQGYFLVCQNKKLANSDIW